VWSFIVTEDSASPEHTGSPLEPVDPGTWQLVIEVDKLSQLFLNPQGLQLPPSSLNADDSLCFTGPRGGVSRGSAGARPGQIFRATTTIRVEGEGEVLPAHFGPMFLGPRDELLTHSIVVGDIELNADVPVAVEVRAPAGAVAVRLRIVGGWAEGKTAGALVYRYAPARLYRKLG
jgi:hypothetical protein